MSNLRAEPTTLKSETASTSSEGMLDGCMFVKEGTEAVGLLILIS